MIYREAGQFKSSYASDQAIFPIVQDRWVVLALLAAAVVVPTALGSDYWLQAILIPFLIYAPGRAGLNVLTGYAGQLSLGTGGFMAVGGYAAFKFATAFPASISSWSSSLSGLAAAAVGLVFGIPSLRIKGFYLAVATLASQFFLIWLFNKVAWFSNYAPSGTITAPARTLFGVMVTGPAASPEARYADGHRGGHGLRRSWSRTSSGAGWGGRGWPSGTATSPPRSSRCGRCAPSSSPSGSPRSSAASPAPSTCSSTSAARRPQAFDINLSFLVLFMVIIGGLGSVLGSFLGAAFIVMVPIFLVNAPHALGLHMPVALQKQLELMVFGGLILFFLIVEPNGLARLWQITKEKLRLWPFPH